MKPGFMKEQLKKECRKKFTNNFTNNNEFIEQIIMFDKFWEWIAAKVSRVDAEVKDAEIPSYMIETEETEPDKETRDIKNAILKESFEAQLEENNAKID